MRIFVIANQEHEAKRCAYLTETLNDLELKFDFWGPTYKNITALQQEEFGISSNLRAPEMSLVYNMLSLAKYLVGLPDRIPSLILESDAILRKDFASYLPTLRDTPNFDMIHLGDLGEIEQPEGAMEHHVYAMQDLQFTEAILWFPTGLEKLLAQKEVHYAFDWHLRHLVRDGIFTMAWHCPRLVHQGSQDGTYESTLGNTWHPNQLKEWREKEKVEKVKAEKDKIQKEKSEQEQMKPTWAGLSIGMFLVGQIGLGISLGKMQT